MKKTAIFLMILMMLSKLLGFARELVLSYFYGISDISDIYLMSISIPTAIFGFVATGISTAFIPIYSTIENKKGTMEADNYTGNLVNIMMITCSVLTVLGIIFTEKLIGIFIYGFVGETLHIAIQFTRISLITMYFIGLVLIFSSYLQLKGDYYIFALSGIPLNLIYIFSIFVSIKSNIYIMAIGGLLAIVLQFAFMVPFIKRRGYKHTKLINLTDSNIKKVLYMALPMVLGVSVNQINILIDKIFASNVTIGGISALNYADKLNDFILGLFVMSVITVTYPMMSKMLAEKSLEEFSKTITETINLVNLLVVPTSIGIMMFSKEIVILLYNRGAFTISAVNMTTGVLYYYFIGILGIGLVQVLYRVFYSFQDTKTPMVNAVLSILINIILNIVLSKLMGLNGIALATSISALLSAILLFYNLKKRLDITIEIKKMSSTFTKALLASIIMGLAIRFMYTRLYRIISENISLVLVIIMGFAIYSIIIYFMRIEEIENLVQSIKRKLSLCNK